jgi:acyl carrier protein
VEEIMTFDRIKNLIVKELSVDESKVKMDSKLVEDLGVDSLDTVELLMSLEDEFGIQIPDEEAMQLTTVESIVNLVDSKLNK